MNLFRFGVTSSKRKTDDGERGSTDTEISETSQPKRKDLTKDQKYDREQRERKYLPQWKINRPWLDLNEVSGLTSCLYCLKFPTHCDKDSAIVRGTKHF